MWTIRSCVMCEPLFNASYLAGWRVDRCSRKCIEEEPGMAAAGVEAAEEVDSTTAEACCPMSSPSCRSHSCGLRRLASCPKGQG
jgi:hypothetical protein